MVSLPSLMTAAEQADSDYRDAVIGAANARADFEERYHQALARSEGSSAAARKEDAEIAAGSLHRIAIVAEAREKAAKTHVQVLLGLLVAQQSINKFAGIQDGGNGF